MKTLKSLVITAALILPLAGYADTFYKPERCYLFIPRIDVVAKGRVVTVTDQEVVFETMGRIWPTDEGINPNDSEIKTVLGKMDITKQYLDSKDRSKLEYKSATTGMNISYSRANLTGIELDRCGK